MLILALLLNSAWACKPEVLSACASPSIKLDKKALANLQTLNKQFDALVSKYTKGRKPAQADSCFNEDLLGRVIYQTKKLSVKGSTCPEHIQKILATPVENNAVMEFAFKEDVPKDVHQLKDKYELALENFRKVHK